MLPNVDILDESLKSGSSTITYIINKILKKNSSTIISILKQS